MTDYTKLIYYLENENAEETMRCIDSIVNNFSFSREKFVEAIIKDTSIENKFFEISKLWLIYLSFANKRRWLNDDRNKFSCMKGELILSNSPYDLPELDNITKYRYWEDVMLKLKDFGYSEFAIRTVLELNKMHRTLQQTFSGAVFYYLYQNKETYEKVINPLINKNELYDDFYKLPMI